MHVSMIPSARSRQRWAAATVAGLLITLTACGSDSGDPPELDESTLIVVAPDEGISWAVDAAFPGGDLQQNLHATILRKPYVESDDSNVLLQDLNDFEGYLAEDYSVSDDGLVYTFDLKEDVLSAAGNPLDVDDVLWSFERKFNTPTSLVPSGTAPAITDPSTQFSKIDDYTFSITLEDASSGFTLLSLLSDVYTQIFDSDLLLENATDADPYAVEWSKTNPNYGFGAYTVDDYQDGVEYTLKANPNAVFEPAIETVVLRVVADPGNRASAVVSGDADVARQLLPADQAELADDDGVVVPTISSSNIFLNMPLVTNKPPFDDVLVRQAMAYAVPYDEIIENVYYGRALHRTAILSPDRPGYDASGLAESVYDPERASELLAEAGYPDGVSFTLTVPSAQPDAQQAAIQIQSFAREAGFEIELQPLPAAAFAEGDATHAFQSYVREDGAITQSPPYELRLWTTPGSSENRADWENQEYLDAVTVGERAGDPFSDAAGTAWNAAERILLDEMPMIFVATKQPATVTGSWIDGFAWRTDVGTDYSQLTKSAE